MRRIPPADFHDARPPQLREWREGLMLQGPPPPGPGTLTAGPKICVTCAISAMPTASAPVGTGQRRICRHRYGARRCPVSPSLLQHDRRATPATLTALPPLPAPTWHGRAWPGGVSTCFVPAGARQYLAVMRRKGDEGLRGPRYRWSGPDSGIKIRQERCLLPRGRTGEGGSNPQPSGSHPGGKTG